MTIPRPFVQRLRHSLQRYRLLPWEQKVSNARLLLYAPLAYAIAGPDHWHALLLGLNTLALLGLIMFQGALNDYWDARLLGERNASSALAQPGAPAYRALMALSLPLLLCAPLVSAASWPPVPATALLLLLAGALLSVCYSVPPVRLKQRSWLGVLVAPTLTTLMFLEAVIVLRPATVFVAMLALLLFLFQWYAEMLHILSQPMAGHAPHWPHAVVRRCVHVLPLITGLAAAGLALRHPIFVFSVLCAGIRHAAVQRRILCARAAWHSPLLAVYEFAIYGALGMARWVPVACVLLCAGSPVSAQSLPVFERAASPRAWSFPRDHGAHPAFRMEWWHVVGTLQAQPGDVFGFQGSWFRTAHDVPRCLARDPSSVLSEAIIFHGAVSDIARQRFIYDQQADCRDPGLLHAAATPFVMSAQENRLEQLADGAWLLRSSVEGYRLALKLTPVGPVVLHGAEAGLTPKGRHPGEASYYASLPWLAAEGYLETRDGAVLHVTGRCWLDHEFGTEQLGQSVAGWDWMAVNLDDGAALMLYRFRDVQGHAAPTSFATLIRPDGRLTHLDQAQAQWPSAQTWVSARNQTAYPAHWRVRIAAMQLELEVVPMLADQELDTSRTSGITYWEGLCRVQGRRGQEAVSGWAYTELTGYAQALNGRL